LKTTGGIPLWMFSGSFMGMAIHSSLMQEQKLVARTPVLDVQLVVPCLMKWPTLLGKETLIH